jgi:acetyl esterase/lipase
MTANYDPNANYEIKIWEEDFRQVPTRMLLARIYQPIGDGPFPVLLDLHGGAWTFKDRMANVAMAEAMARSGLLTVSVDLRLGGEAPYPASVEDESARLERRSVHDGLAWQFQWRPRGAVARHAAARPALQRTAAGRTP